MNIAALLEKGQKEKVKEAEERMKGVKGTDKSIERAAEHVSGADK